MFCGNTYLNCCDTQRDTRFYENKVSRVMYIAKDIDGQIIDISDAVKGNQYYCPICGEKLIVRNGKINVPHFSHETLRNCDSWDYDMSEWHRNWQLRFPKNTRERIITYKGVRHRADVLVDDTVIEFQHSRMSNDEFWERNEFYTNAGYTLIWLFDLSNEWMFKKTIEEVNGINSSYYRWKYHWHTFDDFVPKKQKSIQLYFQMGNLDDDNMEEIEDSGIIEHVIWFSADYEKYMSQYTINNECLSISEFIGMFQAHENNGQKKDAALEFSITDLYDEIPEVYVNDVWSVACPDENGKWVHFENCHCCKYSANSFSKDSVGIVCPIPTVRKTVNITAYNCWCLYRFQNVLKDWDLEKDKLIDLKYDITGKVTDFLIEKGGVKQKFHRKGSGKTIFELLRKYDPKVIGVINLRTGTKVKIPNSLVFKNKNSKIIHGYLKNGTNSYSDNWCEIYNANKPEWIIEWIY